jgi:hypothetical protein
MDKNPKQVVFKESVLLQLVAMLEDLFQALVPFFLNLDVYEPAGCPGSGR